MQPGDTAVEPNIGFVTPRLATGGDLHPDERLARNQLRQMVDAGVTHIMDCRIEWSDQTLTARWAPEIVYLHNGVDDDGGVMPDFWFDVGMSFLNEAFDDPSAKVVVHCHMGINRGPSMVFRALLDEGYSVVEALDAIRVARTIAAIGYAHDALDHFHRRAEVEQSRCADDQAKLDQWFKDNQIDVLSIIRGIRAKEGTFFH